jgi:hypothetical protein
MNASFYLWWKQDSTTGSPILTADTRDENRHAQASEENIQSRNLEGAEESAQDALPAFSYSARMHQFVVALQVDESCRVRLLMQDNKPQKL